MSFLLYCVFQTRLNQEPPHLSGANNIRPVLFITDNNLSAAVSRVDRSDLTPDTSHVLAYEKIIALLHRDFTVIPMRYGCVLEEESQIIRLLESRREAYTALLSELEGYVEFGIRALPCDDSLSHEVEASSPHPIARERHSSSPGLVYLAARKLHHARQEQFARQGSMVIEKIREPFAGLYIKCKVENQTPRIGNFALFTSLLSLYFLVPRESVEVFRKRFYSISVRKSPKLLLSGPWPPFNFVESDHAQGQSKLNAIL
jgi:hypothetical protein